MDDNRRLIEACKAGDVPQVKALLRRQGVDVNTVNEDYMTPLMIACCTRACSTELVDVLLDGGAVPNTCVPWRGGLSWFGMGLEWVSPGLVSGLGGRCVGGWTALMYACGNSSCPLPVVQRLLRAGADADVQNGSTSPLRLAVDTERKQTDRKDLIRLLLTKVKCIYIDPTVIEVIREMAQEAQDRAAMTQLMIQLASETKRR